MFRAAYLTVCVGHGDTEFYTWWLMAPALMGLILFIFQVKDGTLDHPLVPVYSLFIALWSTLFLEFWRRRNVELAHRWGVMKCVPPAASRTCACGFPVVPDGVRVLPPGVAVCAYNQLREGRGEAPTVRRPIPVQPRHGRD